MSRSVRFRGFVYSNNGGIARMSAQARPKASLDALMAAHSPGMSQSYLEQAITQHLSGDLTQIPFIQQYVASARQQLQQKYDTDMIQIRQLPEPQRQQQQAALEAYLMQQLDKQIEIAAKAYVEPLQEQNRQLRQQQYDAEVNRFQQVFFQERALLEQTHPPNRADARTLESYYNLDKKFQDGIIHFNNIYEVYEIRMYGIPVVEIPQLGSSRRNMKKHTRRKHMRGKKSRKH
jgi:hypothetical protein